MICEPYDTTMCGSFNFEKLLQGYWGVIRLLGVFNNFILKLGMIGVHDCMGVSFLFRNSILDE
jgi:hypothetical protein